MIDLRYIKKLIDMLDGSSVDSVEISSDKGMKLRISKSPQQRGTVQMTAPMQMPARVAGPRRAGSAVDAVEISSDKGMKLRISESPQQRGTVQMTAPMQMPAMIAAPAAGR